MLSFMCNKLVICVIILQFFEYSYPESDYRGLPLEKDLLKYLDTIENAINFYSKDLIEVDISVAFGLFLSNVHLKRAFIDKEEKIPSTIKKIIANIFSKIEEILKFFKSIASNLDYTSREFMQITKLFTNSSQWVNRVNKLVYRQPKSNSYEELVNKYNTWKAYLNAIENVNHWVPDPYFSDKCLVTLSLNPTNQRDDLSWCPVADSCYKMLKNGTDFGYALQHRLVLIEMAHLGRGCAVLSPKEDRALMTNFCSTAYAEAEYIAMNNYANGDLILEIMCLCSLDGRAEFLRRSWLKRLSNFQLSRGCFGIKLARKARSTESFDLSSVGRSYDDSWNEECNAHTTGLALGTFSTAVRFIIEEYY